MQKTEECSYTSLTLVTFAIVSLSALATFIVANQMYHGTPCRRPYQEDLPTSLRWESAKRLNIDDTDVTVLRLNNSSRCYVVSNRFLRESVSQYEVIEQPLDEVMTKHLIGKRGADFCQKAGVFLVGDITEHRRKRAGFGRSKRASAAGCKHMLMVCRSGEIGEYSSCYEWTEQDKELLQYC